MTNEEKNLMLNDNISSSKRRCSCNVGLKQLSQANTLPFDEAPRNYENNTFSTPFP
jgi:hypothetical protein